MSNAIKIIESIGRKRLARALGVRATAVSEACSSGLMPARWFKVVRRLHPAAPEEAFSFIPPPPEGGPEVCAPSAGAGKPGRVPPGLSPVQNSGGAPASPGFSDAGHALASNIAPEGAPRPLNPVENAQ